MTRLLQVEVLGCQGKPRIEAISQVLITEQTIHRWPKQYAGIGTDQMKELMRFRKENYRLRYVVSDLTLDMPILFWGDIGSRRAGFQLDVLTETV